jgi:hypothetical protein
VTQILEILGIHVDEELETKLGEHSGNNNISTMAF